MRASYRLGIALISLSSAIWAGAEEAATPAQSVADVKPGSFYIFVDKQANQLSLRSLSYPQKILKTYRAITGAQAGDKIKEGDNKTPEGVYFINEIIPNSRLIPSLHGKAGVGLNYPNPADRINEQNGHGIWIHGVGDESRLEKRFDTKGCVALGNQDVLELKTLVVPGVTPVVIIDSEQGTTGMGFLPEDHPLKKRVQEWAKVWSEGTHDQYMSFYSPDFYSRSMNYAQWNAYKKNLKSHYKYIKVTVENLELFRHPKYTVAAFDQIYESDRYKSRGRKRLYLVGPDDSAQIIAEESMTMQPGLTITKTATPSASASVAPSASASNAASASTTTPVEN